MRTFVACAALLLVNAASAEAQFRPVIDTTPANAANGLASIYQVYNQAVAENSVDASLWHDLGINAWRLSRALEKTGTAGTEPQRISRIADSALAMAAALEPGSAQYQLDMAWKLQTTPAAITRAASKRYLERAVNAARKKSDSLMIAVAALEYGRTFWWRFDAFESRRLFTGLVAPRSVTDAMNPLARAGAEIEERDKLVQAAESFGIPPEKVAKQSSGAVDLMLLNVSGAGQLAARSPGTFNTALNLLRTTSKTLPSDLSGDGELVRATALFSEAYQFAPWYPGTFRAVAMTWLGRGAWGNLERFAAAHLRTYGRDSLAWLALGLAQYRQGKLPQARATFDTALRLLGPRESERLMSWRRILPPQQRDQMTDEQIRSYERLYWRASQPFFSDSTRDPRIEFYARVAQAELRWTVEEFGLSGADSDRGDVFIRHGPPSQVMGFGTSIDDNAADVVSFWVYPSGLIFAFSGMPTYAIMRTARDDRATVAELNARFPVDWDNIQMPQIDSLPAQVARFRGAGDSVDVAVASTFGPPDTIAASAAIASPVQRHLWLIPLGAAGEKHLAAPLKAAGPHMWRESIAPVTHIYRVESFAETATRGGRGTGSIDATPAAFPASGFGLSDILVAATIRDAGTVPRRWRDLPIDPAQASVTRGEQFALLWENYELGSRGGQSEYDATITIRNRKEGAAQIVAEVVGALARVARIDRAPSQVTVTFTRTVPASAAFADWVTVRMPDAPAGTYDVKLTVNDRVTGATASRTSVIEIRDSK